MMRRLFLALGAILLASGLAFSQASTATVSSTGSDNGADVEQIGNAQTAAVTQTGNDNDADVFQEAEASSYGPGEQESTVIQDGHRNSADVSMEQLGDYGKTKNTAFVEQVGNDNVVDQKLFAPAWNSGQHASAKQYGNENEGKQEVNTGHTELLVLEQDGNRNESDQYADGEHVTAEVFQTGNDNKADQSVVGANWGYMSADVTITQLGDENKARQELTNYGGSNFMNHATIYQDGNRNEAEQDVEGAIPARATIEQVGNDNVAEQSSLGGATVYNPPDSFFDIVQTGHRNDASQTGVGLQHEAKIVQEGNDNTAAQDMATMDGAFADFLQDGNGNWAKLTQDGGDTATFQQLGNDNTIRGLGSDKWAHQTDGSTADVLQDGNLNLLKLFQDGAASADVDQLGNNNSAVVNQHGGVVVL